MFDQAPNDIGQHDILISISFNSSLSHINQTPQDNSKSMSAFPPFKSTHDVSQLGESTTMKDDLRYNALRNIDARSETSNTEVEDWDTEADEKPRPKRTIWTRVKAWKWLLDTGLLLVIVGLLLDRRWNHHPKSHAFELGGDISGFAPHFSQQIVQFAPDPIFAPENAEEFWSNETQHAWLDIVPGASYPLFTHLRAD
jgi:hypothetical protein